VPRSPASVTRLLSDRAYDALLLAGAAWAQDADGPLVFRTLDLGDEPEVRGYLAGFGATVVDTSGFTGDATALPFRDRTFDVVLLHHVIERCELEGACRVLAEAGRVTKRRLLVGLTTGVRYDNQLALHQHPDGTHENQYPRVMLSTLLTDAGFESVWFEALKLSDEVVVVADRERRPLVEVN
jgi:SAM-dependent methyltransferase